MLDSQSWLLINAKFHERFTDIDTTCNIDISLVVSVLIKPSFLLLFVITWFPLLASAH